MFIIPVYMKKITRHIRVNVICKMRKSWEKLIFEERQRLASAEMYGTKYLKRRSGRDRHTPFGKMKVKVCDLPDEKGFIRNTKKSQESAGKRTVLL